MMTDMLSHHVHVVTIVGVNRVLLTLLHITE